MIFKEWTNQPKQNKKGGGGGGGEQVGQARTT